MTITLEIVLTRFFQEHPELTTDYEKLPQPLSGIRLLPKNLSTLTKDYLYISDRYDEKTLSKINKEIPVKHPLLDIDTVDLVEFYGPTPNPDKATMRNVVIFGDAMADRSPCGTGTSAKLATLHHWGEIEVGEEFIYESFIGSLFKGVIKETTKVADYDAVIPMITGSCYLTGVATYLIDPEDPLKYGFQVG